MSKATNTYLELNSRGDFVYAPATSRNFDEIHEVFSTMKGYSKISKHLITLEIGGVIKKIGIFRLVPEGNFKVEKQKRVQISAKDIKVFPDHLIAVYKHKDNVIFIKALIPKASIESMPKNVTTLFRVSIDSLVEATENKVIALEKKSRGSMASLLISKNLALIFTKAGAYESKNALDHAFWVNDSEEVDLSGNLTNEEPAKSFRSISDQVRVGFSGELLLFRDLKNSGPIKKMLEEKLGMPIDSFRWMNFDGESFLNYDFLINDSCFLEAKTSAIPGSASFYISKDELDLSEHADTYVLAKINITEVENEIKLSSCSLFTGHEIKGLDKEVSVYKVKIK